MIFSVQKDIFALFPGVRIGVIRGRNLDNHASPAALKKRVHDIQSRIREDLDLQTLAEHPSINPWRQAYRLFGAKPKKHLSSVESLCRLSLEGRSLRSINPLVDIYNSVSLEHLLPIGGDDLGRIDGDIALRLAAGDEPFQPLNADSIEFPRKGEVVYADGSGILCRRWNWREADRTKMTAATTEVVLFVEALPPKTEQDVEVCLRGLEALIREFCGGELTASLVEASGVEVTL